MIALRFVIPQCKALAKSREFGWGRCYNHAKTERFGLPVCNVHARLVDRLATGHGAEYALGVARHEWRQPEAKLPLVARGEDEPR